MRNWVFIIHNPVGVSAQLVCEGSKNLVASSRLPEVVHINIVTIFDKVQLSEQG